PVQELLLGQDAQRVALDRRARVRRRSQAYDLGPEAYRAIVRVLGLVLESDLDGHAGPDPRVALPPVAGRWTRDVDRATRSHLAAGGSSRAAGETLWGTFDVGCGPMAGRSRQRLLAEREDRPSPLRWVYTRHGGAFAFVVVVGHRSRRP